MNFIENLKMEIATKQKQKKRQRILEEFRKRNNNTDFTLIAQNCIGGVIYSDLGLTFRSPLINMFVEDENFIKLAENPMLYFNLNPEPITNCYIDPADSNIKYPKISVGDIEICCLHYNNCSEAIDSWNRRVARVNYDNIYIIGNSWNLHNNMELIKRLCQVQYPTALFTIGVDNINEKCIPLNEDIWKLDKRGIPRPNITDMIPNSDYRYFEKIFDHIAWLNQR